MMIRVLRPWLAAFAVMALMGSATAVGSVFRWDIIKFSAQGVPQPGGTAFAFADNNIANASITLTGSGTFETSNPLAVTGGGSYTVRSFPEGSIQSRGTYQVTHLVQFNPTTVIPGTSILGGLAVLAITYSDGSEGILVVNCAISAPPQETEGVTATKGLVDYWSIQGGTTLFHVGTGF